MANIQYRVLITGGFDRRIGNPETILYLIQDAEDRGIGWNVYEYTGSKWVSIRDRFISKVRPVKRRRSKEEAMEY